MSGGIAVKGVARGGGSPGLHAAEATRRRRKVGDTACGAERVPLTAWGPQAPHFASGIWRVRSNHPGITRRRPKR